MSRETGATVSGLWVAPLLVALGDLGFDARVFLRARLGADVLADPGTRIPMAVTAALWEAAGRQTGDPLIALHAAARQPIVLQGPIAYVLASSATLLDGMTRMLRYQQLYADPSGLTLETHDDRYVLTLRDDPRAALTADQVEYTIAVLWRLYRWAAGDDASPRDVAFRHAARAPTDEYASHFGCPARFGAAATALTLDAAAVRRPSVHANPEVLKATEPIAEGLLAQYSGGPLAERLRAVLLGDGLLRSGGLDGAARRLATGGRTLQRRLAGEGTSFARVLDDARRARCLELLREGKLGLDDIAERVGFSDRRALARAFRRWTGTTPGTWRGPR